MSSSCPSPVPHFVRWITSSLWIQTTDFFFSFRPFLKKNPFFFSLFSGQQRWCDSSNGHTPLVSPPLCGAWRCGVCVCVCVCVIRCVYLMTAGDSNCWKDLQWHMWTTVWGHLCYLKNKLWFNRLRGLKHKCLFGLCSKITFIISLILFSGIQNNPD